MTSTYKNVGDVELTRHTLILGRNGAGKSAIIQALQLATVGYVTDVENREKVVDFRAIARGFNRGWAGEHGRFAEAVLSTGDVFRWEVEEGKKEGTFKRPDPTTPRPVQWGLEILQDTLRGDANKVSAWLSAQVAAAPTKADILAALAPDLRDTVGKLIDKTHILDFTALAKAAKDEARALRNTATTEEKTLSTALRGVPPPLLDEQRSKFELELEELATPRPGVSQETYDATRQRIEELADAYAQALAQFQALPDVAPEVVAAVNKIMAAATLNANHQSVFGHEDCWVCGAEGVDLHAQMARLREALHTVGPQKQALEQKRTLQSQLSGMENRLQSMAASFKSMEIAEPISPRYRELTQLLAADDNARRTWGNVEAVRLRVAERRARADRLTSASKALAELGKHHLERGKLTFEDEVRAFLPEGERVAVDLDTARIGVADDGDICTTLYGAQENRVLLALASATMRGSSTPTILVPRDRGWDEDTLRETMEALSGSPAQILIMSTVDPGPVEGWSRVERPPTRS